MLNGVVMFGYTLMLTVTYVGLASGLVAFVAGSVASRPTAPGVLAEWDRRSAGDTAEQAPVT